MLNKTPVYGPKGGGDNRWGTMQNFLLGVCESSFEIYIGVFIEIVRRFANRNQHFAIVTIQNLFFLLLLVVWLVQLLLLFRPPHALFP